jgi:hypothetical protein
MLQRSSHRKRKYRASARVRVSQSSPRRFEPSSSGLAFYYTLSFERAPSRLQARRLPRGLGLDSEPSGFPPEGAGATPAARSTEVGRALQLA